LEDANEALIKAAKILRRVQEEAWAGRNYTMAETAAHYAKQVEEIMNCDNGEAGLFPLIGTLAAKIKGGSK
jgi:hypothetical protein